MRFNIQPGADQAILGTEKNLRSAKDGRNQKNMLKGRTK